jgi:hypothetical protein
MAVVLITTMSADARVIARRLVAPPPPAPDTVVVYGPRQFTTSSGASTFNGEAFSLSLVAGRLFFLRFSNGGANATNRATTGFVRSAERRDDRPGERFRFHHANQARRDADSIRAETTPFFD